MTPTAPPMVADPELLAKLLFNTVLTYGPTGSRKTSQIGEFAEYIYEKTGKPTRLITADGGGYGIIQDYVDAGIVIPWRISAENNPKAAIKKAWQGGWPQELKNGIRVSKNILVPDTTKVGAVMEAMKGVGAYAIEGFYSISNLILSDIVAKGQTIGQEVVHKFVEDGESFGNSALSHYGFAQRLVLDMIRGFSGLPLERILYSSLEGKGEDKLTKATQYGPQAAGGAITASLPAHVGDCLHFEDFVEDGGTDPLNAKQKLVKAKVRVWFQQHPDILTPNITWPAKARVVVNQIQEFRKRMDAASGYFVLSDTDTHSGLYKYLKTQDELLAASTNEKVELRKRLDAALLQKAS